jgi:hypothetical protein
MALSAQALGRAVLEAEVLLEPGDGGEGLGGLGLALEPGGDGIVGELGAVVDGGAVDVGAGDLAVGLDDHLDDHGEAVFACHQGGQVPGEALREHGVDLGGGVDGGRVLARVGVDCGALGNQGVDVGDGDEETGPAALEGFGDGDLVEISRVVVVDRAPEEVREVSGGVVVGGGVEGFDLPADGRGVVGQEAAIAHGAVGDALEVLAVMASAHGPDDSP